MENRMMYPKSSWYHILNHTQSPKKARELEDRNRAIVRELEQLDVPKSSQAYQIVYDNALEASNIMSSRLIYKNTWIVFLIQCCTTSSLYNAI